MADPILIIPRDLPPATEVFASDALVVDDGTIVAKATPQLIVNAGAPVASQAEAIAGADNTKRMTPLRTKQVLDNVTAPSVLRAQAWAEASGTPDPSYPDSKSSKSWAGVAEIAAAETVNAAPFAVKDAADFFARSTLVIGARYRDATGLSWDTFPLGTANIHFSTGGVGVRAVTMSDGFFDIRQFAPIASNDAESAWAVAASIPSVNNLSFPEGTFDVSTHVAFTRRLSIRGTGRRSTVIRSKSEVGFISFDKQYCSFEGFWLQCISPTGTAEYGISQLAGYVSAKDLLIDWGGSARFKNAWLVPSGASPWVNLFQDCIFSTTGESPFRMSSSSFNHTLFSHCTFRSSLSGPGFLWNGLSSHGVLFDNCRWENNKGDGINISGRRGNQCAFVNPYFEHNEGTDMFLGSTSPSWNTNADYMEPVAISGITSWEAGVASIDAYKVRHVSLSGALIGADTDGLFTSGAVRTGWVSFPFDGPQLTVNGLSRRGSATDFTLVPRDPRIIVESGDGVEGVAASGFGPSTGIVRPSQSPLAGAYASHTVTLGNRSSSFFPGVSVFASRAIVAGPSRMGAIVGSVNIDMSNVDDSSTANIIVGSESSTLADHATSQIIMASARVKSASNRSVAGGYAASGAASSANRKWEIQSETGNVLISGALTSTHTFSDFAELFPNAELGEIPVGSIVALDGEAVRVAQEGDRIAGVISATAAIVAGDTPFEWQGRHLTDEFGRLVMESIVDPDWEGEGDPPMIHVQVLNPDWDEQMPQTPRSQRPEEWSVVGLIGRVFVRVGADVAVGDAVAAGANGIGAPATAPTGLRCLSITSPYSEDRGYAVARCLIAVNP